MLASTQITTEDTMNQTMEFYTKSCSGFVADPGSYWTFPRPPPFPGFQRPC